MEWRLFSHHGMPLLAIHPHTRIYFKGPTPGRPVCLFLPKKRISSTLGHEPQLLATPLEGQSEANDEAAPRYNP